MMPLLRYRLLLPILLVCGLMGSIGLAQPPRQVIALESAYTVSLPAPESHFLFDLRLSAPTLLRMEVDGLNPSQMVVAHVYLASAYDPGNASMEPAGILSYRRGAQGGPPDVLQASLATGAYVIVFGSTQTVLPQELAVAFVPEGAREPAEPNESFDTATRASLNQTIQGTLASKQDKDVFLIETDAAGYLRVNKSHGQNLKLFSRIYDAKRNRLGLNPNPNPKMTDEENVFAARVGRGRTFVELSSPTPVLAGQGAYRVAFDFTPGEDAFEPNDTFDKAKLLPLGKKARITLFPDTDNDWFIVDVKEKGVLNVHTHNPAVWYMLIQGKLYTLEKNEQGKTEPKPTTPGMPYIFPASIPIEKPGRYWLKILTGSADVTDFEISVTLSTHRDAPQIQTAFVGLDLPREVQVDGVPLPDFFQSLARVAGGRFVEPNAQGDNLTEIFVAEAEAMKEAVEESQAEAVKEVEKEVAAASPSSPPIWLFILVGVFGLVLVAKIVYEFRKPLGPPTP